MFLIIQFVLDDRLIYIYYIVYKIVMLDLPGDFTNISNVDLLLFSRSYNLPINDWREVKYHV